MKLGESRDDSPLDTLMRKVAPTLVALLLGLPAPALAQDAVARCAPRVEATAAVSPAMVARLTAALASGSLVVPGPCPLVRFDLIDRRLVMTVVLDDGRQVARVLPSQSDALPTLVALLATPPMPAVDDDLAPVEPASAPPVASPPPPPAPELVPPPALATTVLAPVAPVAAVSASAWGLRLGASFGVGRVDHVGLTRTALDVDVLRARWALGVRLAYEPVHLDDGPASGASGTLSLRPRWTFGRVELDAGPAVGARWVFDDSTRGGLALRAGAEASVAVALSQRWSVFARVDGGADFTMRGELRTSRDGRQRHDTEAEFVWGASVGLRWEVAR